MSCEEVKIIDYDTLQSVKEDRGKSAAFLKFLVGTLISWQGFVQGISQRLCWMGTGLM